MILLRSTTLTMLVCIQNSNEYNAADPHHCHQETKLSNYFYLFRKMKSFLPIRRRKINHDHTHIDIK